MHAIRCTIITRITRNNQAQGYSRPCHSFNRVLLRIPSTTCTRTRITIITTSNNNKWQLASELATTLRRRQLLPRPRPPHKLTQIYSGQLTWRRARPRVSSRRPPCRLCTISSARARIISCCHQRASQVHFPIPIKRTPFLQPTQRPWRQLASLTIRWQEVQVT